MEFKGQESSNINRASKPQSSVRTASERGTISMGNQNNHKKWWITGIVVVVIAALIGAGVWAYSTFGSPDGIKKDKYQAVFLTNGQVYFGKVSGINDKYVSLTDIYYLQVQQSVQPADSKSTTNASGNSQVSLAQLGGELHGPDNQMYINRDQVLFWENLKDNGKVVEAIKSNQNK